MSNLQKLQAVVADVISPIDRAKFPIFVFGPYLLQDDEVEPPEDSNDYPKYLRFLTKVELQKQGYTVHFGENNSVMNLWTEHMHIKDEGTQEIIHASKLCGAVIIFASSVGSFCELGLFAGYRQLMQKTLVIIDKQYEDDESFFNKGLIEIVLQENGSVIYEDYSDFEACYKHAIKFSDRMHTREARRLLKFDDARRT